MRVKASFAGRMMAHVCRLIGRFGEMFLQDGVFR
jgi:hypothetical protein